MRYELYEGRFPRPYTFVCECDGLEPIADHIAHSRKTGHLFFSVVDNRKRCILCRSTIWNPAEQWLILHDMKTVKYMQQQACSQTVAYALAHQELLKG